MVWVEEKDWGFGLVFFFFFFRCGLVVVVADGGGGYGWLLWMFLLLF